MQAAPLTCARCERLNVGGYQRPGAERCRRGECGAWVLKRPLWRRLLSILGR